MIAHVLRAACGAVLALLGFTVIVNAQTDAPMRLGLMTVKTGPLATGGIQMEQGLLVFLQERNYTLAGRKVELIVADTGGSPAGARTKVQELVERDKVDAIIGPLAAFEALAINDYVKQAGVPTLGMAAAEDMTQRNPNPWFVRASATSAQGSHPLGEWAANEKKYQRILTIADDVAYGQEMVAGFQRAFEDAGGKVVKKLWPPLNVPDYGAYIAQIGKVDAVYMSFAGANGLRFMRQYAEYGLKDTIPLIGGMTSADESILKNMGDEALGVVTSSIYSADLPFPANQSFVAAFQKTYKADPGYYAVVPYLDAMVLEAALVKTGGKTDDKKALMDAIRSVQITDSPRGPFHLDQYGNAVGNIYILDVQRKQKMLKNVVLKTYEGVSQFWSYDPQWFLSQPVYSRDFPPANNLE